jgi:hypothetical protein
MFYFLEGAEAVPLCRSCLIRQERERALSSSDSPEAVRAAVAALSSAPAAEVPVPGAEVGLEGAVRTYLAEELGRVASSLERMPEDDAGARLARQLQQKAEADLRSNRLADAVLGMGDLRRNLAGLDPAPAGYAPAAPWDESVDELFERVTARARALTRPPPAAQLDPDGSPAFEIPSPRSSEFPGAPS